MKVVIFVPDNLMTKAFHEADRKVKRNIYIYLWYIPCIGAVSILFKIIFMGYSFADIGWQIAFTAFFIISLIGSVKNVSKTNLQFVQILPFIYIYLGIMGCSQLLTRDKSIDTYLLIICLIVGFLALKDMLKLRKLALKKIK